MMNISFKSKPIHIPAEYRPMYKIGQILLILKVCCRSDKSTLMKIHLFSWGLKNIENKEILFQISKDQELDEFIIWSIEPSLNRALDFCIGNNLCKFEGSSYKLSERGQALVSEIIDDEDIFVTDKLFLQKIGKKISERKINSITSSWSSIL